MLLRTCKKCLVEKELNLNNFHKHAKCKEGFNTICKECKNKNNKEYYENNKEIIYEKAKQHRKKLHVRLKVKERSKFNTIKRKYGLSKEEYLQLIDKQDNCCAICRDEFTETNLPCVDHITVNGKVIVRGILCYLCNLALGYLKEDVEIVRTACSYMEYHSENLS